MLQRIRSTLAARGDPARALDQQRYMKSAMPYHGLTAAELRTALRPVLAEFRPVGRTDWADTVREVWDGATHREERYAAIALARHRLAQPWHDVASLDLFRHLVITGAWWDVVDEIASHLVGSALRRDRAEVTPVLRTWMVDPDVWLRRSVIIAQLDHRAGTDTVLLHDAIVASLDDRSFWARKAIGWALRQHRRTDPGWVDAEVDRLSSGSGPTLSGLSRREALKHRSSTVEA